MIFARPREKAARVGFGVYAQSVWCAYNGNPKFVLNAASMQFR
jgi:hypothetical protein